MKKPRVIGRVGRTARCGAGGLGPDAAHTILTFTDGGGGAALLVTTAGAHGLSGSENITIAGATMYNGPASVSTVESDTTFVIDLAYEGDATGGTWQLA